MLLSIFSPLAIDDVLPQTDDLIAGNRFKCTFCADINLCQSYHKAGVYGKHQMLTIKDPADILRAGDVVCLICLIITVPLLIFVLSSQ